jgi:hypothetical protein
VRIGWVAAEDQGRLPGNEFDVLAIVDCGAFPEAAAGFCRSALIAIPFLWWLPQRPLGSSRGCDPLISGPVHQRLRLTLKRGSSYTDGDF